MEILFLLLFYRATSSPSTMSVAKEIVRRGGIGLNGLNKGLTSTIGRNGTWNLIYFGFYHSVKDTVPQCQVCDFDFTVTLEVTLLQTIHRCSSFNQPNDSQRNVYFCTCMNKPVIQRNFHIFLLSFHNAFKYAIEDELLHTDVTLKHYNVLYNVYTPTTI